MLIKPIKPKKLTQKEKEQEKELLYKIGIVIFLPGKILIMQ